jgi:hypothetical protein
MSDDIGSSKSFNKKFLKKKYEYEKKARRNQNNNQTKYQEEDDDVDEEDDNKDEVDEEDDNKDEENNKDEKVKNKKSININTKLNSKFYSGDSEDSEEDDNKEEYQGILSKKGNIEIFECNPRLGGASYLSSFQFLDSIKYFISENIFFDKKFQNHNRNKKMPNVAKMIIYKSAKFLTN